MRFTTYLLETYQNHQTLIEKHDLVLQKVIDAVDDGHVDYSDYKITFDIGTISDTPQLRGLKLVIRPATVDDVKLGRNKDGEYAIVINTTGDMPGRQDIDTFLARKTIYDGFKRAYEYYIKNFHDNSKDVEPNEVQKRVSANRRENFEASYIDLVHAINDMSSQYRKAVNDIDSQMEQIANAGKRKALELAKEKLRDDFLGKNAKEFISKVMKLPEADFASYLDKAWKEKLELRLTNFYNSSLVS